MPWSVAVLLACLLGAVALASLVVLALDRLRGAAGGVRRAMSVVHGLVAAFVVVDVITLLAGHRPEEMLTHVGYAVASLGLPTLLLSRPDQGETPDPPHLGVVAIAAAATAICVLRLQQTW